MSVGNAVRQHMGEGVRGQTQSEVTGARVDDNDRRVGNQLEKVVSVLR